MEKENNNHLQSIDWNSFTNYLASFCSSEIAANNIKNLTAFATQEQASKALDECFSALEVFENAWSLNFTSLDTYKTWHSRITKKAILDLVELKELRIFLHDCEALLRPTNEIKNLWTNKIFELLLNPSTLLNQLERIIHPDGSIKSTASSHLSHLFAEKRELDQGIQNHLDKLVKDHKLEVYLQDKFVTTREGRWVVPIKNGMQGKFKGIIHDTSRSEQTVFMEPEAIVKTNNKVKEIEIEIQKEIKRILTQYSKQVYEELDNLETAYDILLESDCLFAKVKVTSKLNLKNFDFSEQDIQLNSLKNPILLLKGERVIANDLGMNQENRTVLLSGPNAGGKTVLLKSLGMAAQMARCGIPLAVSEDSKIPFFENIYISVGDSQDIKQGLSSFASHLRDLSAAYKASGFKDLVLVDEICGSTDPEEGSAIAKAFIERFYQQNVFCLVTSHFSALKSDWLQQGKLTQASMEFDETTGKASYHLLLGIAGDSHAWKVAKNNNVPQDILDRVLDFLSSEHKERQNNLEDVEKLKQEALQTKIELQSLLNKARLDKEKYEKLLLQLEKEKEQIIHKSIESTKQELDDIVLKAREGKLQKTTFEIKAELPQIIKKQKPTIHSLQSFSKDYPPGSKVFVPSLGKEAIIQSKPNEKGEVFILSGSMRLSISWQILVPKKKQESSVKVNGPQLTEEFKSEIDFRGMSSEQAREELEQYLDQAVLNGLDQVKLIHGIGTGSLRKSLRSYLSSSHYVDKWQSGKSSQENDGITWVFLK